MDTGVPPWDISRESPSLPIPDRISKKDVLYLRGGFLPVDVVRLGKDSVGACHHFSLRHCVSLLLIRRRGFVFSITRRKTKHLPRFPFLWKVESF